MSNSASKLTGGQGQHRQHTATLLHPAAAVFRDEILGDVGDRSKTLEVNNARFRNLANLIQDIKLSFYTRGEEDNVNYIEHHETLGQGSILTTLDDEERLVLPVEDAPVHPILDNGGIGLITLYMAGGVPFGSFPYACNVHNAAKESVEEDGSVRLVLHLSKEIFIEGKLHSSQMTNAALIEHVDQTNFMSTGLFDGEGEYRKGVVFTPQSISIQVTPWLKKIIALADQVSSPGESRADVELESEDELCRLLVDALGDREHKEMFSEYIELKQESSALSELRSLMLGVSVSHSRGSFTVTLDEGRKLDDFWCIAVDVGDGSPVSELHSMQASFLGMQLRLTNGIELILEMHPRPLMHPHRAVWRMRFQACCSNLQFYFLVSFNWSEFTGEEIADIVDRFPSKMSNALGLRGLHRDDTATFPLAFKANIVGILCDLSWAECRLKRFGLWEE